MHTPSEKINRKTFIDTLIKTEDLEYEPEVIYGLRLAYLYLQEIRDASPFLTMDIITTTQFLLSGKMDGMVRTTTDVYTYDLSGRKHFYERCKYPTYITNRLQGVVDTYNSTLNSAQFFLDFLAVHAFCDKNGRTSKTMLTHIFQVIPFQHVTYDKYLQVVCNGDIHELRKIMFIGRDIQFL